MSTASPEGASVPATIPCPMCGMPVSRGTKNCPSCAEPLWKGDIPGMALSDSEVAALTSERDAILAERKRFNRLSFLMFGLAVLLPPFIIGGLAGHDAAALLLLIPIGFGFAAFGCYAKYKGRTIAIALFGFLGIFGLLVLALIPDKHQRRLKEIALLLGEQA